MSGLIASRDYTVVRRPLPDPLPAWLDDYPPALARVLAARGVAARDELEFTLAALPGPEGLPGIAHAVALLQQAVTEHWRILVIGDFDADGATSTALAMRALGAMGAAVDFLVPNRFEFGYGLTEAIVTVAAERSPDLIVTVDNGIASLNGVRAANERGIKVLVTDHHLPGDELPAAEAIVNPTLADSRFPSRSLAGVGVIFYVMLALRSALRQSGWFASAGIEEPNLAQWLDLVALGTVADVVPLDRVNRILVAQGMARIRSGEASQGINALIRVATRDRERLSSSDLSFGLAPRLNAAGRLDDMSLGIRCLLAGTQSEALKIAGELDALNRERRAIEHSMCDEAYARLEADVGELAARHGVCLYDPSWHQGVIGILAARVKERLHRPVVIFTDHTDELVRGSARSVAGLHIRDALDRVATRHPGLLIRFGGHAMAAGMTLKKADLQRFADAFDTAVQEMASPEVFQPVLLTDGPLAPDELTIELADTLRLAMPWGQGFATPTFDNEFEVANWRWVGESHLKLRLRWPGGSVVNADAIAFNLPPERWPGPADRVHLVYRLEVNIWQGVRQLQLQIDHLRALS